MARPGLSYEEVIEHAKRLIDNGENPSIMKIRESLGGRGSPNTISKYLKEWKESQSKSELPKEKTIIKTAEKPTETELTKHNTQTEAFERTKKEMLKTMSENTSKNTLKVDTTSDKNIQTLITHAKEFSQEILASMSNEWDSILNESDDNIKIRRLHAALIKEQSRREAAEQIACEAKAYTSMIKDQVSQRIHDVKEALEEQIGFLKAEIKKLKKESEENLLYYRERLDQANKALADKLK